MEGITLTPIQETDLPFLQRVYASTRQAELAATGWPQHEIDAFLAMQFQAQHQHYQQYYPEASFDIIRYGGQAAGRLYVDRTLDDIRIVDIALLPEHRGKGIGTALTNALLAEGRETHKGVAIHVAKSNPAMNLYQRLGFVKTADKGVYDFLQYSTEQDANHKRY